MSTIRARNVWSEILLSRHQERKSDQHLHRKKIRVPQKSEIGDVLPSRGQAAVLDGDSGKLFERRPPVSARESKNVIFFLIFFWEFLFPCDDGARKFFLQTQFTFFLNTDKFWTKLNIFPRDHGA
jgi:hypothetical protein